MVDMPEEVYFLKESEKPLTPKRAGKGEYTVSFLAAFSLKK